MKDAIKTEVTINPLFKATGIDIHPQSGKITLTERMEPPEKNPLNDWLYAGILALKDIAKEKKVITAACIGTGQGIDAIVVSDLFHPKTLYITDIVGELLEQAKENIERNTPPEARPDNTEYLTGKDCDPLPAKVDLIVFSPPPLMAYHHPHINEGIARTTIIEAEPYLSLANGPDDIKLKWSTLPQYQFLLSAKAKLNPNGIVLTLYTGRIPFRAIEAAYHDAGFELKVRKQIIKRQTDPQFLKEYATYERERLGGDTFDFFDFEKTRQIMKVQGFKIPGIVEGYTDESLKAVLADAKIDAQEAYALSLQGKDVAHIGYALEGKIVK